MAPWDIWIYPASAVAAWPLSYLVTKLEKSAANRIYLVNCCIRFGLAFMMALYGLSKIMGQQFALSHSDLDQRIGQATGAMKTWAFFGHSSLYEAILGWGEVAGAWLILFHQTVLPGAALLAIMLVNIAIANFTHDIGVRANSCLYLAQACLLLWPDRLRIVKFLQGKYVPDRAVPDVRTRRRMLLQGGRWATLILSTSYLAFNQWMFYKYRPAPHPLVGIWRCRVPSPILRLRFDNERKGSLESVGADRVEFNYNFSSAQSTLEFMEADTKRVLQIRLLSSGEVELRDESGQASLFQRADAL